MGFRLFKASCAAGAKENFSALHTTVLLNIISRSADAKENFPGYCTTINPRRMVHTALPLIRVVGAEEKIFGFPHMGFSSRLAAPQALKKIFQISALRFYFNINIYVAPQAPKEIVQVTALPYFFFGFPHVGLSSRLAAPQALNIPSLF